MIRAVCLVYVLLLLPGCATEVPVVATLPVAKAPPECRRGAREAIPKMAPFPRDPAQLMALCPGVTDSIQCVNLLWARHRLDVGAVVRRNAAREDVCLRFVERVAANNQH